MESTCVRAILHQSQALIIRWEDKTDHNRCRTRVEIGLTRGTSAGQLCRLRETTSEESQLAFGGPKRNPKPPRDYRATEGNRMLRTVLTPVFVAVGVLLRDRHPGH